MKRTRPRRGRKRLITALTVLAVAIAGVSPELRHHVLAAVLAIFSE